MGFCSRVLAFSGLLQLGLVVSLAGVTGCQTAPPVSGERIAAHVANIDFSGLSPDFAIPVLDVRAAIPHGWKPMSIDTSPLYTHEQWRSPTHSTGIGVAFIHMPLPMSAKAIVWFAKGQYARQTASQHKADAHLLGEWTDSLNREWFEGENDKYHIKGYVVTSGCSAWAVYSGYRLHSPPSNKEISLAFRSMDSIVPLPLSPAVLAQK